MFPLGPEQVQPGTLIVGTLPIQKRATDFLAGVGRSTFFEQTRGFQIAQENVDSPFIGV